MPTFQSFEQGVPCWIEHSSGDVVASQEFYTGLFGWEFDDRQASPEAPVYSMATLGGSMVAGLGPVMDQAQPPSWGVYLAVDSVDEALERARNAGGTVVAGPMDVGSAGRMAWVVDTAGAAVGLWQAGDHLGTERANEPGTNIWNELVVPDPKEVAGFYEQVFGLAFDSQEWPGMGTYTTLQVDGRSVGGACPPSADGLGPHWNVYFNVASADETAERVRELGGEVTIEPLDIPGVGRMATFSDPAGAMFHVMQNPPEA
jgi:uncharacterized protein